MPSYLLRVRSHFDAAHHLTSYRGAPEPSHGHSWIVEASLTSNELDGEGMSFDFVAIKAALDGLAGRFDHRDINTVPPFDRESPTTERLAAYFYSALREALPGARLAAVSVWEGADCSATYVG